MSDMANTLYPSTAAAPAAPAAPAPVTPTQPVAPTAPTQPATPAVQLPAATPAEAPFELPAEIKALRSTTERRMYGKTAFASELPDTAPTGWDNAEARQVAQDLNAESEDVATYASLAAKHASGADAATRASWVETSTKFLADMRVTEQQLNDARQLVARDPRVFAHLEETGLGSHPDVVKFFVNKARQHRNNGGFNR